MGDLAGRGLDNCHSLVFDDGFCDATPPKLAIDAAASRLRAGEQTRSVTALALGPETRLKSLRPARRPRGDSYARRCDYGRPTSWPVGLLGQDGLSMSSPLPRSEGRAARLNLKTLLSPR